MIRLKSVQWQVISSSFALKTKSDKEVFNCHSLIWRGNALEPTPPHPHKLSTANISAISQRIELKFFFGNPPVGISNDQTEEQAGAELGQAQCLA